jgi:hypothetical protein
MIRNIHKQRKDPIQTIMINNQNYVEITNPDSAEDIYPQYDFVSNFPPVPPRV